MDPLNHALRNAAANGDGNKVALLLNKGANPNASVDGWTALMCAAKNGHLNVVEVLLNRGADVNASDVGKTALMLAASNGHVGVVDRLLQEDGIDVNATDNDGKTALMWAAGEGRVEVVKALLAARADVNLADRDGKTALMWAKTSGHNKMVNALRNHAYFHKSLAAKIIYPTVTLASIGAIVAAAVLLIPGWPMALAICAAVTAWMASEYSHNDRYDRSFVLSGLGLTH